jgi:signal peptidase I
MLTVLFLALMLFAFLSIDLGALWLGARWAKVGGVTVWRLFGVLCSLALVSLVLNGLFAALIEAYQLPDWVWSLLQIALSIALSLVVISRILRVSLRKSIIVWLPVILVTAFNLGVAFLIIRPYVLEGFITSSNSGAPTLVGPHVTAVCPRCGGSLIIPWNEPGAVGYGVELPLGICASCLQTAHMQPIDPTVRTGDRFISNKLLAPRRWDLVTVRPPVDRSQKYVKRLIGLPGDVVVIDKGVIMIDGSPLALPPEIAGLQFKAPQLAGGLPLWGSPEKPARLGPHEYFVVGDFAERSADSRMWGKGVSREDLVGVATLIYWPPGRCRIFR